MDWIDSDVRFLFFTGKGGVGKTSLACATAVKLADGGRRVLLVSTDPASNIGHVLGVDIGEESTPIPDVPRLQALNIDPEAAASAYRDRIVGPVRGALPEKVVQQMEEELSGACTTEIAAFDEFTALLTGTHETGAYDHVVFDTAPTGHTLRLMKLPSAWSSFLETNQSGASCLGPLSGLEKQKERYGEAVAALADPGRTRLLLVSRPEPSALAEADRTRGELTALGVSNQRLILNGVMPPGLREDPLARAMAERGQEAVRDMPGTLRSLPTDRVCLQAHNLVGIAALRALLGEAPGEAGIGPMDLGAPELHVPELGELVDEMERPGHGLIMVMGKGGVGKTTIAAAVAAELASRGHDVLLTTTDPAAHLAQTIETGVDRLEVSRIDPEAETLRYREHVLATKGKGLGAEGRALLEEDLRSPCTEEIAVFQAFSGVIREARRRFVVVDTAPTGHTMLLLDATGSYHRDVLRHSKKGTHIVTPMMRLRDPQQSRMLIVTLPETTPVLEASALQEDLRRAGIQPWAWVINSSLAAGAPTDPLLVRRAHAEVEQIEKVRTEMADRVALVPWLPRQPVGAPALRRLVGERGEVARAG